jgi:hypothetical protein
LSLGLCVEVNTQNSDETAQNQERKIHVPKLENILTSGTGKAPDEEGRRLRERVNSALFIGLRKINRQKTPRPLEKKSSA